MSIFRASSTQEYSIIDPPQPELNSSIIMGGKLVPGLRTSILRAVKILEKAFQVHADKVWILGTSISYQHTPQSDIDVTIFVDVAETKEFNRRLKEFGIDAFVSAHPVNFHFESLDIAASKMDHEAVYDVVGDAWIKEPQRVDEGEIDDLIERCQDMDEFTGALREYQRFKAMISNGAASLEDVIDQALRAHVIFEDVRKWRREDFKKPKNPGDPSANHRCSNVIFKLLESKGMGDIAEQLTTFLGSCFEN